VNWRLVGTVVAGMLVVLRASLAADAAAGVNGTVVAFAVPAPVGVALGAGIRRRSG